MTATRLIASLVAVAVIAGCSGDEKQEQAVAFTAADAKRIGSVQPATPGWPAWPQSATVTHDDPDETEFGHKWEDDDKLANLVVQLLGSEAEAREWLPKFNEFSRGVAEQTGSITKDEAVDDLGDEAWVLVVGGSGTQVTYHWRRDNVVIEAHVHCYGDCPLDVEPAARAWADAIDAEVRAS